MSRTTGPAPTIELALLGFVQQQPMHGYEIYQRLKAHPILSMIWPVKQSQVYALLAKLEQAGYLASTTDTQHAYPPRKVLHLTPAGDTAFVAWFRSPVPYWDATHTEWLARLFFAQRHSNDAARTLIADQRRTSKAWLDDLNRQLAACPPSQSSEWLILQFRHHQMRAFLDWLSRCAVHFTSPLMVQHTIAVLRDSHEAELAHRFVAYVCSTAGQAILEHYGFLPSGMPARSAHTPAHEAQQQHPPAAPHQSLTIFAAATLKDAFSAIAEAFSTQCGGITIHLMLAGSHHLADELCHGAPADVFAAASLEPMQAVLQAGRVEDGQSLIFARNRLIAVTPRTRTVPLASLHDLACPDIKIALGSTATAIGTYAHTLLEQAQRAGVLSPHEHERVLQNFVFAEDVRAALAKVVQGSADVAIVYTSDYYGAGVAADSLVHPIDELWLHTE